MNTNTANVATFVSLPDDVVATLPNPVKAAELAVSAEKAIASAIAAAYGDAQIVVRAGRDYFTTFVAGLSALRASEPEACRAVYKRIHAACVANNAPFIVQSRKAGLSVIDRTPTTEAAPEATTEAATATEDATEDATEAATEADTGSTDADIIAALRAELASIIADRDAIRHERDALRAELVAARRDAEAATGRAERAETRADSAEAALKRAATAQAKRAAKLANVAN